MYPKALEAPGMEKSFISLFMIKPVSGTIILEPNQRLMVLVSDMVMPDPSAVTTSEVPGVSKLSMPFGLYAEMGRVCSSEILDRIVSAVLARSISSWN